MLLAMMEAISVSNNTT
uniref:Uncharacterized protein n=1 Tax=Arundo donax TaxID=35708 RepID=A0A0A8YK27_ARUDO